MAFSPLCAKRTWNGSLFHLSIAQMSYVLLGVVAANEAAATAMTYYLFTYLFMLTGVFGVLIALRGQDTSGGSSE